MLFCGSIVRWTLKPSKLGDLSKVGCSDEYGSIVPEGPMAVGIWECTPGVIRLVNPYSEFCTVTRGRVTVTDGDGNQVTFGPGDSFFIAQGEPSTWNVHEDFQKSFFFHIDAE